MNNKYFIKYTHSLIGGAILPQKIEDTNNKNTLYKEKLDELQKLKNERNIASYKSNNLNLNLKESSTVLKYLNNFESDNDVKEYSEKTGGAIQLDIDLITRLMDAMYGPNDPTSLELVESDRALSFPLYITNPESYERIKEIIKSKWTRDLLLTSDANSCQLNPGSTLQSYILIRAGLSIGLGLRLVGKRVITHGLTNAQFNNKEGINCYSDLDSYMFKYIK